MGHNPFDGMAIRRNTTVSVYFLMIAIDITGRSQQAVGTALRLLVTFDFMHPNLLCNDVVRELRSDSDQKASLCETLLCQQVAG